MCCQRQCLLSQSSISRACLRFAGERRVCVPCHLHNGMCHEDSRLWVPPAPRRLPSQRMESAGFPHRHHRVGIWVLGFQSKIVDARIAIQHISFIIAVANKSYEQRTAFFCCRLVSTILSILDQKGFDVKALRAFRVLRPLRLVSGVPSEYAHWWRHLQYHHGAGLDIATPGFRDKIVWTMQRSGHCIAIHKTQYRAAVCAFKRYISN